MPSKIVILLTSAGSRAVEAIIACLEPVRAELRLVGANSLPSFVSLACLDAAWLVAPTADAEQFTRRMEAIVEAERPDMIICGRDEEVAILSALAARAGCLFLGPPPALAPLFEDKYETSLYSAAHGLPFVRTACDEAGLDAMLSQHGFPLIAKPRRGGYASRDVYLIHDHGQAIRQLGRGNAVFQPILGQGAEQAARSRADLSLGLPYASNPANTYYMLDLLLDGAGVAVSACASRAEGRGGIFHSLTLLDDAPWCALLDRYAAVLARAGHCGPVNVQGALDREGQFAAFEWNARFVGCVDGFALLGANLVLDALLHFFPGRLDRPAGAAPPRCLFRPMRFEAVPDHAIAQLSARGRYERG